MEIVKLEDCIAPIIRLGMTIQNAGSCVALCIQMCECLNDTYKIYNALLFKCLSHGLSCQSTRVWMQTPRVHTSLCPLKMTTTYLRSVVKPSFVSSVFFLSFFLSFLLFNFSFFFFSLSALCLFSLSLTFSFSLRLFFFLCVCAYMRDAKVQSTR